MTPRRRISQITLGLAALGALIGAGGIAFNIVAWAVSDNTCDEVRTDTTGDRETLVLPIAYAIGYTATNVLFIARVLYDSATNKGGYQLNDAGCLTASWVWLFFFSGLWTAAAQTPAFLCQNTWAYGVFAWGIVAFATYSLMACVSTDTLLNTRQ
jgi:hypothetical protein